TRTIATALGIREEPGRSLIDSVMDALRDKRLLVVLDNCEHLVSACASLADRLLRAISGVCLLATSREALNITGETAFLVPSMAFPDPQRPSDLERIHQYEAVQLFLDRAGAVQPAFSLTPQNAHAVTQICARVDGIPHAMQLPAPR